MAAPTPLPLELSYTSVYVHSRTETYLTAVIDDFADENPDHSLLLRWRNGQFGQLLVPDHYVGAIRIAHDSAQRILGMGVDGTIVVATPPAMVTEPVDPSDIGPSRLVLLRSMTEIGGQIYVAGMARQVYRRESPGRWSRQDQGVFVHREQRDRAVGFHAIDGLTENAIYAVGHYGEIWFRGPSGWVAQDSPTNVVLTCVKCVAEDKVYVGGMVGTLLRGRNGIWDFINHESTTADIWSITWFADKLFVANNEGVFILQDDKLEKVDMKLSVPLTTSFLDSRDGVLWSVGDKDIAMTSDGQVWTLVTRP